MKKSVLLLIFSGIMFFSSCNNERHDKEDFFAYATVTVSDITFDAEITADHIKFYSENLTNELFFQNSILTVENQQIEISPIDNSALNLNHLILEILTSKNFEGVYKNTKYHCEFDKKYQVPKTIVWGDILVKFNYFE
ncbi:MAG: hypothetical protein E7481_00745 [Ruminococcaceae bacterium]|nr:hypothetical protein [Oscillospiraceae bacterium]